MTDATGLHLSADAPTISPMPSSALVSVRNVSFSYGGKAPALTDVSLDVDAGITVGLIGPNGGGKTTLLKILLGELTPDSGEVSIAGMTPRQAVRAGGVIGYLPQAGGASAGAAYGPGRLPVTVRQAVRLGLAGKAGLLNPYAKDDVAFADRMIERVGLAGLHEAPLKSLSGGQIQRAYVARALAPRPRLLLLDEPTTGIDRGAQQRLAELLTELKAELSLTLVLVSHDLRAVTGICDRIACLDTTLHYHDVPHSFPEHLARGLFCCDLEAMGLGHGHGDRSHHCAQCGDGCAHTPPSVLGAGTPTAPTPGATYTPVARAGEAK